METILDAPMAAVEAEETTRIGFFGGQAGDSKDCFVRGFVGFNAGYLTVDAKDLADVGEIDVVIQFRAGPNLSDLKATMSLIDGLVLRGEKRPGSGPRYLLSRWADCLLP